MSGRQEWTTLAAGMRAEGKTRAAIAQELRGQFKLGALAAMRHAYGWSQQQAAREWTERWPRQPKTYKDLSGWETGRHTPPLEIFDRLAQLYACDLADLLADRPGYRDRDEAPASAAKSPPVGAPSDVYGLSQDGTVMPDWFLTHAAGNVVTVLDLLGSRAASTDLPERLTAIRAHEAHIDAETLEGLAQVTLGFRRAYRSASAASLLSPAYGTLGLLIELAPEAGNEQRDNLVSLIGQMGSLIGTLLMLDLGDFETSRHYLAIAVRAAQQSDDTELLAFGLGCRAFHAAYSGNLVDGVAFADGSLDLAARGIAPRTHGWLAAVASEMHASHHDELQCEQLLERAAVQLERVEPADPWLGIGVFNADKLTAYRGGDFVRLGRYRAAQTELHRALDALDPSLKKHRATACVDLAEAYVAEGRLDDGAEHAINALDIATGTRHAETLRRVEVLHAQLKPARTSVIQRLGERLLDLKAAS